MPTMSSASGASMMGPVTLARVAKDHLRDGESITLPTGILAVHPMPGSASISMVNAGLEGFVRAAAPEMPRNLRVYINLHRSRTRNWRTALASSRSGVVIPSSSHSQSNFTLCHDPRRRVCCTVPAQMGAGRRRIDIALSPPANGPVVPDRRAMNKAQR